MDGEFDEYGEIAGYEIDETELGLNLVKIQLYFDSLNVKVFEESKTLTFEQLLSGIAGLLGLFLGFSIQTFGEYIEFFIITPLKRNSKGPAAKKNRVGHSGVVLQG